MNDQKEYIISRIVCGYLNFKQYRLGPLTRDDKYKAEELYQEILGEARWNNVYSPDDVLQLLYKNGIWSDDKQKRLDGCLKDIEEFKVKLFQLTFKSHERQTIKKMLKIAKDEVEKLYNQRHSMDMWTDIGIASLARFQFSLIHGLRKKNGQKVFKKDVMVDSAFLDELSEYYSFNSLQEEEFREIARTDPWRNIWTACKNDNLFGIPIIDLAEDQKTLILWSKFYDNVYESPDSPSQQVVEDDDRLDGWLILQRRKADQETLRDQVESKLTGRMQNADEIFIPVDTAEEAKKIDGLNSIEAKIIKMQRSKKLQLEGEVKEQHFADRQIQMRQQLQKMAMDKMKG